MPPPNDNFANATDVGNGLSGAVGGSNVGATIETFIPVGQTKTRQEWDAWKYSPTPAYPTGVYVAPQKTVWFTWTCPKSGNYYFATFARGISALPQTNFNSTVDAWYGHNQQNPETMGDISEFAYLYNQAAGLGNLTMGSMVAFTCGVGTQIWIRVGSRDGSAGTVYLEWGAWTGAPRLGNCNGCVLDLQSENCLASLGVDGTVAESIKSFGSFPAIAGYYKMQFCGSTTPNISYPVFGLIDPWFGYVSASMPIQPVPADGTALGVHSVWLWSVFGVGQLFYTTQDILAEWLPIHDSGANSGGTASWNYLGVYSADSFAQFPGIQFYQWSITFPIGSYVYYLGDPSGVYVYQATKTVPAHNPGSTIFPAVPVAGPGSTLCADSGFFCASGNIGIYARPGGTPSSPAGDMAIQLVSNVATIDMFVPYQYGLNGSGTSFNTAFAIRNMSQFNWGGFSFVAGGTQSSPVKLRLLNAGGITNAAGGNQGNGSDWRGYDAFPKISSTDNFQFNCDLTAGPVTAILELTICDVVIGQISFPFYPVITVGAPTVSGTLCLPGIAAVKFPISSYIITDSNVTLISARGVKFTLVNPPIGRNSIRPQDCSPGVTTVVTTGPDNGTYTIGLFKGSGAMTVRCTPYYMIKNHAGTGYVEVDLPSVDYVINV